VVSFFCAPVVAQKRGRGDASPPLHAGRQDVWGRPVDVTFAQDGSLLFSDDGNGMIYRVRHKGQ
jgi:glucose/arabinose dehydrogenase